MGLASVSNYTIHNASEWPLDRLGLFLSDIVGTMGRLTKRFPSDVTTAALFQEFLSGKKTLWLVLDDGAFVSMALSTIKTIDATGTRIATLCDLAGNHVQLYAAELCAALEAWADKNACSVLAVEGRVGWEKLLKEHGYKPHAVLYRKSR